MYLLYTLELVSQSAVYSHFCITLSSYDTWFLFHEQSEPGHADMRLKFVHAKPFDSIPFSHFGSSNSCFLTRSCVHLCLAWANVFPSYCRKEILFAMVLTTERQSESPAIELGNRFNNLFVSTYYFGLGTL